MSARPGRRLGSLSGVVPTALNGLASSDITDITANDNQDNDDNGQVNGASSRDSSPVAPGGASEPTDEQLRSDDPTDDDADSFADNQSNYAVDFGFWPLYRIGNLVWKDGNNDGLASPTPSESGINGVLVQLTDASGDTVLRETVTAGGGKYEFASLVAGTYRVQIPADQTTANAALSALIVSTALEGFHPSTVASGTPEDDLDNDSNGVPTCAVNRSGVITLGGTEPVTEQLRFDDTTDDDLG